jgi:hypothetical protein
MPVKTILSRQLVFFNDVYSPVCCVGEIHAAFRTETQLGINNSAPYTHGERMWNGFSPLMHSGSIGSVLPNFPIGGCLTMSLIFGLRRRRADCKRSRGFVRIDDPLKGMIFRSKGETNK